MMVSQRFSNSYDNSCSNIIVRPNKYVKLNCNPPLKNIFIPKIAEMNSDRTNETTGCKIIKVFNTNTFECLNCQRGGSGSGMSLTQLKSHVNNKNEDCCFSKVKESMAKYTDKAINNEINNNERSKSEIIKYSKDYIKFMCAHCSHTGNKNKGLIAQGLKLHFENFCTTLLDAEEITKNKEDLKKLYQKKIEEEKSKESKNKKKKLKDLSGEIETSLSVTSNLNTADDKVVTITQDSLQNLLNDSNELKNVRNQLVATDSKELKNVENQLVATQEKVKYYKKLCFKKICSSCHTEGRPIHKCKVCKCFICTNYIIILGMNNGNNMNRLICVNCSADNPQNAREWFEELMCHKDDKKERNKQNEQKIEVGDEIYRFIPFKPGLDSGLFLIIITRIIGYANISLLFFSA